MSIRVLAAGLVGGIAMFVWMFVAHMLLPLGQIGVQEIPNEPPVLSTMQASLGSQPGVYVFPATGLPPNATSDQRNAAMREYANRLAAAPSGFLVYHGPGATFNFLRLLIVELALELFVSVLAVWALSLTRLNGFLSRAGFVAMVGIVAATATNISYWNWYSFPADYTAAYVFMQAMGFVSAGLAAAGIMKRNSLITQAQAA